MESILEQSENTILANIIQFSLFSEDKCNEYVNIISKNANNSPYHGSMQKHTVDVSILLKENLQLLLQSKLLPIINNFFNDGIQQKYVIYTAHAILYKSKGMGERSLNLHTDDSDITINITLNTNNLEGNELEFYGSTPYSSSILKKFERFRLKEDKIIRIQHKIGSCLIHKGNHPHLTRPILNGDRIGLVVWLKKIC